MENDPLTFAAVRNGMFVVLEGNWPVPRLKAVITTEPFRTTVPFEASVPSAAGPPTLPLLL